MSFEAKYSAFSTIRLRQRELGFPDKIGAGDALAKSLYCAMEPCNQWDPFEDCGSQLQGGVFNLEFSPEGSLLVAACEKKSILIFDPLTYKKIHSVNDAHSDCVNCVKFLDGRMFATCSDDTTIALWDIRNLKKRIRTLYGHSNWVKNIEYSVKDNLLVTSGLDGSIYTWDINSYTEWSLVYQRVFHASGLMRCRISPDASQMVMCTTGGLLIIVHNLNLSTLAQDLHGFKPNMYRLMQMSLQQIPIASSHDHLFDRSRKKNRIEFISDFPEGNDAEVVSSLQIHPQGWCALSRNISHDNRSEWTCIHDIQADDDKDDTPIKEEAPENLPRAYTMRRFSRHIGRVSRPRPDTRDRPSPNAQSLPTSSRIHNDVWEASITIKQHRTLLDMASRGETGQSFNMQRIMGINTGISPPDVEEPLSNADSATGLGYSPSTCPPVSVNERVRPSTSGSTSRTLRMENDEDSDPDLEPKKPSRSQIRQNKERLLYYSQEPNLGKGFIKELCFSSDGRLVCSPYGYGMRLLALSDDCSELSHCYPERGEPRLLTELGQCIRHEDLVVSSKFSPRHHLLVTGCLAGRIVWYQPLG